MRLSLIISIGLLCSCASVPQVAPRFTAPDLTPIVKAHAAIQQDQAATKTAIAKAQAVVKTLTITLPADKTKVDALTADLDAANTSNDQLNEALATATADTTAAQATATAETAKANQLSNDYNTLHAQNDKAQAIVKQVNRFWGIGAFGYGAARLAKHLFIMIAVLAVAAIAILVLSFFFPFIIPVLRTVGGVIAAAFRSVSAVIRGL